MRVRYKCVLHSFSLHHGFVSLGFPGKVFNDAVQMYIINIGVFLVRF
jgi:hypothetical protein